MSFKYTASVIVPVYNVSDYLEMCVDSLVNQTIDKEKMEILLINDGSTDNSLDICRDYEEKYPFIKVFSKENEGLSATRNYGIERAQGKYLFFIDSDDYFSEETVESVTDFFDTVYDQVDLVTYFEQPYTDEAHLPSHFRFKYFLKNSGVYSLENFPYILQMRINVCVKNLGEDNYLFDTTPEFRQEDQEYNNRVLMPKMKIGYCDRGCYFYNKSNENSIVATKFNAINLFERSMDYLEKLMSYFDETEIPKYFQAVLFHDLKWKLEHDILFPYHYDEEEFEFAMSRIRGVLERIDNDTIVNYPGIRESSMIYWLAQKETANLIPYVKNRKLMLISDGSVVYKSTKLDIVVNRVQPLDNGNLLFRCYTATPIYNFIDEEPEIYVLENGSNEVRLSSYPSKYGYLEYKERVLNYYAFEYEVDVNKIKNFRFYVKYNGFEIVTRYGFTKKSVFNNAIKLYKVAFGNSVVELRNTEFYVNSITDEERDELEIAHSYGYCERESDAELRVKAIEYRKGRNIWLYNDLYTVEKDNAYYQFINDFDKDDGVERYYVYSREYKDIEHLFTDEQKKRLVKYGSDAHKLLYLSANVILTSYYGRSPISPFEDEEEEAPYYEIEHFKVIYLQHGVLHASLYVQNSAENARADKIIISSEFEKQNYMNNYYYREDMLVPTAMARYDHIDRTQKPKGRILFAPSWRNYLSPNINPSKWQTDINTMKKSSYFKNICAFLENEELANKLEESGIILELKLHPIIADDVESIFNFKTKNIIKAERNVNISDYDMFITDFSSFLFDYACLERPMMYFVPDYTEFTGGLGHYRSLDLPFEEGLGKFTKSSDEAAKIVIETIDSGFKTEEPYKTRMAEFFYPLDNCCERLYKYIKETMKK